MFDAAGVKRVVFPRLLSIIADMKEKWELVFLSIQVASPTVFALFALTPKPPCPKR